MFAKWLEEYRDIFSETGFMSQLLTFLIAVISIFSVYSVLRAGYQVPEYVKTHWESYWISVVFHLLIVFYFGVRFVLLFSSSKRSFWLSQLFWVLGFITLFAWRSYTSESLYGFFNVVRPEPNCFDCGESFFLNASNSLNDLGYFYFFASLIRQFVTLIISLARTVLPKIIK
ncbi:MAG: hypothetical protein ACR2F2_00905 [Pyrinomonadaceae bacterium]